eukprot:CAMPEP_0118657608 /NCGR_PEP_ID=MMETSP0785-20121206/14112_1 /TAXON_ID=91992 /ORGANISM="Bolidomonas pacifica, Strain CCMP 1866" /LENGTH=235 /DNA_ID=CAMNT_0006550543 /DNA_START=205 /DNA_END=912 /DNA_ORIENTATION=+
MPAWTGDFPLAEGLVVLGFILMVAFEQAFASPCNTIDQLGNKNAQSNTIGVHCHHTSSCPPPETQTPNVTESSTLLPLKKEIGGFDTITEQDRYKMYMLEVSISVHSVLVGLPVTSSSSNTLVWALLFHQLFEGMSLGLAALTIGLDVKGFVKLSLLFGSAISLGVILGYVGLSSGYWQGYTNSVAAGIVLFVAFEFYHKDFGHGGENENAKTRFFKFVSFVLGASLMAILAIWA